MKKHFIIFTVLIFSVLSSTLLATTAYSDTNMRDYRPIKIAKGSFLKAINQRTISTSTVKVGDVQYFTNPADVYIGYSNIIPKNSVFLGEIEELRDAVEGINAAMKIKIFKIITPNNNEYSINANVYQKGSTTLGGDLAPVAYYTKMPHYSGNWKRGALQLAPTSIRQMGTPTVIRAGEEVTFIINEDMNIYKPMNINEMK